MPMRRLALSAVALTLACGPRPSGTPEEPAPRTDVADDAAGTVPVEQASVQSPRVPGVGHTAQIDRVVLSPDGSAALTGDTLGSLRAWPTLDGSAEPQIVPFRNANQFSLARVGTRLVVLVVDGAGGGRVFEISADGSAKSVVSLPPIRPVLEGHVLPDGQLVVLFKDRSIGLLKPDGSSFSTFEERRFRPERLLMSSDGRRAAALVSRPRDNGRAKLEIVPLKIDLDQGGIARTGSPRVVSAQMAFSPHECGLSPDGRSFAFLDHHDGSSFHVSVVDLDNDKPATLLTSEMRSRSGIGVGFVDAHRLLVSPGDGSLATLVDLKDGSMRPRPGPPNDFNHQGRAQTVRSRRQLYAYGSWLYVQDVEAGRHRFLGYDTVQAQTVAVAEGASAFAWGFLLPQVLLESAAPSEPSVTLGLETRNATPWRLRFVDAEHVLAIDTTGNIELHQWRERTVVARAGFIGPMRNFDFNPESGLFAVDRHFNDLRVFRTGAGQLEGPWLVDDAAARFGLLPKPAQGGDVLWTYDNQRFLRRYTMAELDRELTRKEVKALGKELKRGQPMPLAFGHGRAYGVRHEAGKFELFVDHPGGLDTVEAPSQNVTAIHVSPDAGSIAVVSGGTNASVAMMDATTLQDRWMFGGGGFVSDLSWSSDSKFVALATQTGGVVLDAAAGKTVAKRCGLGFRVLHAPPNSAFTSLNQRAICEQP